MARERPRPLRTAAAYAGLLDGSRPADIARSPEPAGPPAVLTRLGEARAVAQLPRLLASIPRLAGAPRGDGSIVIDIPGWRGPESSNAPIRGWLRRLGWDARGWGLGVNRGDPERDARLLMDIVAAAAEESGRPVALVGWSLGGVIAREVARHRPEYVRQVITYGTPVVGGPTHTVVARAYGAEVCERAATLIEQLGRDRPITVPVTAILTRADGVVSWRACVDRTSRQVEHVEVRSTHLGLGLDPDVWGVVARVLATGRAGVESQTRRGRPALTLA